MVTIITALLGGDVRLGFLFGLLLTIITVPPKFYAYVGVIYLPAGTGGGMVLGGLITGNWTAGVLTGGFAGLAIMVLFLFMWAMVLFFNDTMKKGGSLFPIAFVVVGVIIIGFVARAPIVATVAGFLIVLVILWVSFGTLMRKNA
jgi:hypothetical protein